MRFHIPLLVGAAFAFGACSTLGLNEDAADEVASSSASVCAAVGQNPDRFNLETDLLISNFDVKPDLDDIHAAAALGTIVRSSKFEGINYIAATGTYGIQKWGPYLEDTELFNLAFGDNWVDAHNDRENSAKTVSAAMLETLQSGGSVWVQEAGQSDFTHDALRLIRDKITDEQSDRVFVVQHSLWNEGMTDQNKLFWVFNNSSYVRLQDGNEVDNGSPGFATLEGSAWPKLLQHPEIGPVWSRAKESADKHNPTAGYVNPKIEAGGFDFSDTVELSHILGFDHFRDHEDFFNCLVD